MFDKINYTFKYFNPRSHERSDPEPDAPTINPIYFNPRSHERSDLVTLYKQEVPEKFQSTLPREERRRNELFRCR